MRNEYSRNIRSSFHVGTHFYIVFQHTSLCLSYQTITIRYEWTCLIKSITFYIRILCSSYVIYAMPLLKATSNVILILINEIFLHNIFLSIFYGRTRKCWNKKSAEDTQPCTRSEYRICRLQRSWCTQHCNNLFINCWNMLCPLIWYYNFKPP